MEWNFDKIIIAYVALFLLLLLLVMHLSLSVCSGSRSGSGSIVGLAAGLKQMLIELFFYSSDKFISIIIIVSQSAIHMICACTVRRLEDVACKTMCLED